MKAYRRFILVEPLTKEEMDLYINEYYNNIYIPQTRLEKINFHIGKIMSIGDKCSISKTGINVGDLVLYGNLGIMKIPKYEGKDLIAITENHLFLKIENRE